MQFMSFGDSRSQNTVSIRVDLISHIHQNPDGTLAVFVLGKEIAVCTVPGPLKDLVGKISGILLKAK